MRIIVIPINHNRSLLNKIRKEIKEREREKDTGKFHSDKFIQE